MQTFNKIKQSPIAMLSLVLSIILLVSVFVFHSVLISQIGISALLIGWSTANIIKASKDNPKDNRQLLGGIAGIICGITALLGTVL